MTTALKCLLSGAFFGLLMGPAFSQEKGEAAKVAEIPAYVTKFTNLPQEQREEYGGFKLKAEQFFRQKRTFESLDEIHKAQKIFDEDPSLWNLQGSCYVEFRSFEKAKKAFKRAQAIDPKNTGILFNLAEMDFVTKNWKGCVQKMTGLMEQLKENAGDEMTGGVLDLYRLALFKKMLAQLKLGQKDEARQLAKDNWEDWDDTPFTYYSKAALAYSDGDDEEANRWITSAMRVFGGLNNVANWQDTLIEFGYVRSFYGGDDAEIEVSN